MRCVLFPARAMQRSRLKPCSIRWKMQWLKWVPRSIHSQHKLWSFPWTVVISFIWGEPARQSGWCSWTQMRHFALRLSSMMEKFKQFAMCMKACTGIYFKICFWMFFDFFSCVSINPDKNSIVQSLTLQSVHRHCVTRSAVHQASRSDKQILEECDHVQERDLITF